MTRRYRYSPFPLACGHPSYSQFNFSWGSSGCMACARERDEERRRREPVPDRLVAEALIAAYPLDQEKP